MKSISTLTLCVFFLGVSYSQISITFQPTDVSPWDCESSTNPDGNSFFQTWLAQNLNTNDANQLEANSPACEPLSVTALVNGNPYIGSGDWEEFGGGCNWQISFQFEITDNCGATVASNTVNVVIEDQAPPEWPVINSPIIINCVTDITDPNNPMPIPIDLVDACEGDIFDFQSAEPIIAGTTDCDGEVIYQWNIEDNCGNQHPNNPLELVYVVEHDNPIVWIGNPEEYLPSDFSITISPSDCDRGEYFFEDCNWYSNPTDPASGAIWPFELIPGIHFDWEDPNRPCGGDPIMVSSHVPCDGPDGLSLIPGVNRVIYSLLHPCDGSVILQHTFIVTVNCADCNNGTNPGIYCDECNEGIQCFACDLGNLLNGFQSCSPPYDGIPSGPVPLCPVGGGGTGENVTWFRFIAGSRTLAVKVEASLCIGGGNGIQSGVYDACGGECLAGQVIPCAGLLTATFNFTDLEFGADYYVFVDGCGGAECEFEINVIGQTGFTLDSLDQVVVAEGGCQELGNNTFCPGMELSFEAWHDGSSRIDNGAYDPPGPFDPEQDVCISWQISPPLDGFEFFEVNYLNDGPLTPGIIMPEVMSPTEYEICALEAWGPCNEMECDRKGGVNGVPPCITITVAPLEPEICTLTVSMVELEQAGGFDPSEEFAELCVGNIQGWQGLNVSFDDVKDGDPVIVRDVQDPDCNCFYDQLLYINITTSTNDLQPDDYILVFPNPVADILSIEYEQPYKLKLLNSHGQLILTKDVNQHTLPLDIKSLAVGIYYIVIKDKTGKETVKEFVKY